MSKRTTTLGLCVISRSYSRDVIRIINDYGRYFDKIYIQINGAGSVPKLLPPKVDVSRFKWCDDFGAARNALLRRVKTDYWMWLDTDDTILNPSKLPTLLKKAAKDSCTAIALLYHTTYSTEGDLIEMDWRLRIVKASHIWRWINPVHEQLIADSSFKELDSGEVAIVHRAKSVRANALTLKRYHDVMMRLYQPEVKNPDWLLYFLGKSYGARDDFQKAIELFQQLASSSTVLEMVYTAWIYIAMAYYRLGQPNNATGALVKAIDTQPEWPDAYLIMGDWALTDGQPQLAIDWLKAGHSRQRPFSQMPFNPNFYNYMPLARLAQAYLETGDFTQAKQFARAAKSLQRDDIGFESTYQKILAAST